MIVGSIGPRPLQLVPSAASRWRTRAAQATWLAMGIAVVAFAYLIRDRVAPHAAVYFTVAGLLLAGSGYMGVMLARGGEEAWSWSVYMAAGTFVICGMQVGARLIEVREFLLPLSDEVWRAMLWPGTAMFALLSLLAVLLLAISVAELLPPRPSRRTHRSPARAVGGRSRSFPPLTTIRMIVGTIGSRDTDPSPLPDADAERTPRSRTALAQGAIVTWTLVEVASAYVLADRSELALTSLLALLPLSLAAAITYCEREGDRRMLRRTWRSAAWLAALALGDLYLLQVHGRLLMPGAPLLAAGWTPLVKLAVQGPCAAVVLIVAITEMYGTSGRMLDRRGVPAAAGR